MNYCFSCMKQIRTKNFAQVRVRKDFCHSSYWNNNDKKVYGHLDDDGVYGVLFLHTRCTSDDYSTELGEGFEACECCNTVFSDEEFSGELYEKTGDILCAHCARDYVEENLEEFLNSGLPNFESTLPSVNLNALSVNHNTKLRVAPEDTQGWCSSIMPHETRDIGHGTYEDAIKAIVDRGNKWLIVVGRSGVTHNVCAVAVTVYEYEDKTPFSAVPLITV